MTPLCVGRYLDFGLSRVALRSARTIIDIAQTGRDRPPGNRHHVALADRVRERIQEAGGIAPDRIDERDDHG